MKTRKPRKTRRPPDRCYRCGKLADKVCEKCGHHGCFKHARETETCGTLCFKCIGEITFAQHIASTPEEPGDWDPHFRFPPL